MTDYRKKPVVIQAVQWTGQNAEALRKFVGVVPYSEWLSGFDAHGDLAEVYDFVQDDWIKVNDNDWIIKGVAGEFYPCADAVFKKTYDEVEAK